MASREGGEVEGRTMKDEARWKAAWEMRVATEDARPVMAFEETGRGELAGYDGPVLWRLEGAWTLDGGLIRPYRTDFKVERPDGTLLERQTKRFDFSGEEGTVVVEETRRDGSKKRRTLKVPSDTLVVEGLGTVLRALPLERGEDWKAHLMTPDLRVFKVTFKVQARERVTVPAGTFEAYRVRLDPHLGLLSVAELFTPQALFWFRAETPFSWVAYEGLESGLGSPKIRRALLRFHSSDG